MLTSRRQTVFNSTPSNKCAEGRRASMTDSPHMLQSIASHMVYSIYMCVEFQPISARYRSIKTLIRCYCNTLCSQKYIEASLWPCLTVEGLNFKDHFNILHLFTPFCLFGNAFHKELSVYLQVTSKFHLFYIFI